MLKPRQDDGELILDARAAILAQSEQGGRLLIWLLLSLFVVSVAWAYNATLEEVVRGQGKVIPSSQVQVVQNLEGGIVKEIAVREGDTVLPGQALIRIDDTRFDSSFQEGRIKLAALRAKSVRLAAEAGGAAQMPPLPAEVVEVLPAAVDEQTSLFDERQRQLHASRGVFREQVAQKRLAIAELESKQQRLARSLGLARRELEVTRPLQAQGAVSEVEILRLQRQVNDLQGELDQARLSIPRVEAELAEVERRLSELEAGFRKDARAELNDILGEMNSLSAGNVALEDRVRRTVVRSPIRGVVNRLFVNTRGGVIQPGMDLVEIVPLEDTLVVEAKLKPRDIALVRPGLEAMVKLTAYDFAIYGGLEAQVEHVSADTIVDENGDAFYEVRVRTAEQHLVKGAELLEILPGMTAEVDILVGEKTVLDYLMKPVLRARHTALREP